jgi:PAS domain S-box-containing protein
LLPGIFHRSYSLTLSLFFAIVFTAALALFAGLRCRTRRSRSAQSLPPQDGESQFRTLAEAIPQIVWKADADGQTNYINQRWYEMTGLDKGGGLGSSWAQFVHPDDRAICMQKWTDSLRSGQTFEIEYRLRDRDDRYRWFINRAVPLRDASGVIKQWFGSCTDIDDQMCHQQLLEAEIKARAIVRCQHQTARGDVGERSRAQATG